MVAKLTAQVVVEAALCQAGEERARERAEPVAACEAPDRALNLSGAWLE